MTHLPRTPARSRSAIRRALAAAAVLLAAGTPSSLAAQRAGEAAIGVSMSLGPRTGFVLSAKVFVADDVAVHCGISGPWPVRGRGCGASLYGVLHDDAYLTAEVGHVRMYADLPPPPPPEGPSEDLETSWDAWFIRVGPGVQLRSPRLEELRPTLALGPALMFGEVGHHLADEYGFPVARGPVQPLFFFDVGLEVYALSR